MLVNPGGGGGGEVGECLGLTDQPVLVNSSPVRDPRPIKYGGQLLKNIS